MDRRAGILHSLRNARIGLTFLCPQALWLAIAYRLELLGEDVFFPLWVSSVVFLGTNSFVLVELVKAYR